MVNENFSAPCQGSARAADMAHPLSSPSAPAGSETRREGNPIIERKLLVAILEMMILPVNTGKAVFAEVGHCISSESFAEV